MYLGTKSTALKYIQCVHIFMATIAITAHLRSTTLVNETFDVHLSCRHTRILIFLKFSIGH